MAKAAIPVLYLILFLISVIGNSALVKGQKTWCVSKPSADNSILSSNIEFACNQPNVDCTAIRYGGPCFYPNTNLNHASVAMNLYFQAYKSRGGEVSTCYFANSGLRTLTDPSYADCKYL